MEDTYLIIRINKNSITPSDFISINSSAEVIVEDNSGNLSAIKSRGNKKTLKAINLFPNTKSTTMFKELFKGLI